jgi:hypothetical protein
MSKHDAIADQRDTWVRAVPGRAYEVSLSTKTGSTTWRVALLERGSVLGVGQGPTWELAFLDALETTRNRDG